MRQPTIAVATFVWNERGTHFLAAKRLSGKYQGYWNLPGGHLEWMEAPITGASREVWEEVGINAKNFQQLTFDSERKPEIDHCWVVLFYCAQHVCDLPPNPEPDKNSGWKWMRSADLPEKTLEPMLRNVKAAQAWATQQWAAREVV